MQGGRGGCVLFFLLAIVGFFAHAGGRGFVCVLFFLLAIEGFFAGEGYFSALAVYRSEVSCFSIGNLKNSFHPNTDENEISLYIINSCLNNKLMRI